MSDADHEKKSQKIWAVFGWATNKARGKVRATVDVDYPNESGIATVTISLGDKGQQFNLKFYVQEDDSIIAANSKYITPVAIKLYDDNAVDTVANAIKNAVAKEFL